MMELFKKSSSVRVGLDIGTKTIKMAHLQPTAGGIQLLNFGISATPIGAISDGVITNPEAIGKAIKQIIITNQIKEKKVICSVPSRSVIIRQVLLPPGLKPNEVMFAVRGEVEKFLPFPFEDMQTDHKILGEVLVGGLKQTSVIFVATHKDIVAKRLDCVKMAGLESVEMDIDVFITLRALVESSLSQDLETFSSTIIVLDIGASSTTMSILNNGILRLTRVFNIGGENFTHAIENNLRLPYLEAEKTKKEKAVALKELAQDSISSEIYSAIKPHLQSLVVEINRSIAYYNSKHRGEELKKIILTGGASLLKGLDKFLQEELGTETIYGNPLSNIAYTGGESEEYLSQKIPFLSTSIGLALREMPPKILKIKTKSISIDTGYEFGTAGQMAGVTQQP